MGSQVIKFEGEKASEPKLTIPDGDLLSVLGELRWVDRKGL